MSKITIEIDTSNAAFGCDESEEVARILRDAAHRIEMYGDRAEGPLRDLNGNTVGKLIIETD